jgi:hypothetical protein
MSGLGQKQTYALQKRMSALHLIATAIADSRTRSCPLYPRKRTFVGTPASLREPSKGLFNGFSGAYRQTDSGMVWWVCRKGHKEGSLNAKLEEALRQALMKAITESSTGQPGSVVQHVAKVEHVDSELVRRTLRILMERGEVSVGRKLNLLVTQKSDSRAVSQFDHTG